MCNLYSITTNQAAIIALFRVVNRYVRQPPADARRGSRLPGTRNSQRQQRPRADDDALGYAAAPEVRWAARHQLRNTSSPHWRGWLKPENRCLVPANSFSEYAPEPNPETKKDVV
jgi:putative SOS response-associated peptidase YedK